MFDFRGSETSQRPIVKPAAAAEEQKLLPESSSLSSRSMADGSSALDLEDKLLTDDPSFRHFAADRKADFYYVRGYDFDLQERNNLLHARLRTKSHRQKHGHFGQSILKPENIAITWVHVPTNCFDNRLCNGRHFLFPSEEPTTPVNNPQETETTTWPTIEYFHARVKAENMLAKPEESGGASSAKEKDDYNAAVPAGGYVVDVRFEKEAVAVDQLLCQWRPADCSPKPNSKQWLPAAGFI